MANVGDGYVKVYRVTSEATCYKSSTGTRFPSFQGLYYELGYIVSGNRQRGNSNNIYERIERNNTGYYYFIFLEDALNFVLYQTKASAVLKIMEFDFPEEVVYSLIGFGRYDETSDYNYGKRAETYISDSKVSGDIIDSTSININIKRKLFCDEFRKCASLLKEFYATHDYEIAYAPFRKENEKLLELSDEELLKAYIDTPMYSDISDYMYAAFLSSRYKYDLIKTPAVSSKSSMILLSLWDDEREKLKEYPFITSFNIETLKKDGFVVDYSKSGIECRIDFTKMIAERDYEGAKKLLSLYRR